MARLLLHPADARRRDRAAHGSAAALELELERSRHENDMLISIGRALSQERDIQSLLAIILRRACEVTNADAGSIYIVEGTTRTVSQAHAAVRGLAERLARRCRRPGSRCRSSSTSIVGTCVLSGDRINVPDLYALDEPGTGQQPVGLHPRPQLRRQVPLPDPLGARGADDLGARRGDRRHPADQQAREGLDPARRCRATSTSGVVPFDDVSEAYVVALASQAGIALENVLLYEEVKTLFDGFVKAAVTAIESRDPTTSGHSERVAELTVGLAQAVDRADSGPYREVRFSRDDLTQIQYAALLHDFGKVGVREHVLVKAKKLYEHERELILQRFQLIKRGYKIEGLESQGPLPDARRSREQVAAELAAVDRDTIAQGRGARRHHQVHPRRPTSRRCSSRAASSGSPRSPGMTYRRRARRRRGRSSRTTRRAACRSGAAR